MVPIYFTIVVLFSFFGTFNSLNLRRLEADKVVLSNSTVEKDAVLSVFFYVTSGPANSHLRNAGRRTWLTPCKMSRYCDYRFFIDKVVGEISAELAEESEMHKDIVFRGKWCPLMDLHPSSIHYGNCVVNSTREEKEHGGFPQYPRRKMFKIDWKVCFLKWMLKQSNTNVNLNMDKANFNVDAVPLYHVFVEDDSFTCTANLLHQTAILRDMPREQRGWPFRIGTPMWDGFDDSSTFMSREVALAFAQHYNESGFNCSRIADDPHWQGWLSWGNSWMKSNCDWRGVLQSHLNISINVPNTNCLSTVFNGGKDRDRDRASVHVSVSTNGSALRHHPLDADVPWDFPCMDKSMILHHGAAAQIILGDAKVSHVCEYMLLIDKVKDPNDIYHLWKSTAISNGNSSADAGAVVTTTGTGGGDASNKGIAGVTAVDGQHGYHNFSFVFTNDGYSGWLPLLQAYTTNEYVCSNNRSDSRCIVWRRQLIDSRRRVGELTATATGATAKIRCDGDVNGDIRYDGGDSDDVRGVGAEIGRRRGKRSEGSSSSSGIGNHHYDVNFNLSTASTLNVRRATAQYLSDNGSRHMNTDRRRRCDHSTYNDRDYGDCETDCETDIEDKDSSSNMEAATQSQFRLYFGKLIRKLDIDIQSHVA